MAAILAFLSCNVMRVFCPQVGKSQNIPQDARGRRDTFKTLDEICKKLSIRSKSHIISVCKGDRTHVEKWRFSYFDVETNKPVLTEKHTLKAKKVVRKVICLNDNKIITNGVDAGIHYGLNSSAITNCAQGNAKSVYRNKIRLRFAFLDDNGIPILKPIHNETISAKGKRRILSSPPPI